MRKIVRYERVGTSFIGYSAAGRAVGIITDIGKINTAEDSKKVIEWRTERVVM